VNKNHEKNTRFGGPAARRFFGRGTGSNLIIAAVPPVCRRRPTNRAIGCISLATKSIIRTSRRSSAYPDKILRYGVKTAPNCGTGPRYSSVDSQVSVPRLRRFSEPAAIGARERARIAIAERKSNLGNAVIGIFKLRKLNRRTVGTAKSPDFSRRRAVAESVARR
jgi:hypothetical protein